MRNRVYIENVFSSARKTENALMKFFNKHLNEVKAENAKKGLGEYECFAECNKYETDDMYGKPKKIKLGNMCIWESDCWVNSNEMPKNVKVIDYRFPLRCVSLWYTPYNYMKTYLDPNELYRKSETEKVLFKDSDIKISMVRRNVIPFFKSLQYCHKISKHEYVLYLRRDKRTKRFMEIKQKLIELSDKIRELIKTDLDTAKQLRQEYTKLSDEYQKRYYWHECFSADKLSKLETKAKRYFNEY